MYAIGKQFKCIRVPTSTEKYWTLNKIYTIVSIKHDCISFSANKGSGGEGAIWSIKDAHTYWKPVGTLSKPSWL